jgi:hypothetical protein
MEARRVSLEYLGRGPAVCLLDHVHHFALDGQRYTIFRGWERVGVVVLARRCGCDDVKDCLVCGTRLVTVEL